MAKGKTPRWIIRRAIKRNQRNCAEKKVYKTIEEATTFAKRFNGHQRVYICKACGEYHLATVKEKE